MKKTIFFFLFLFVFFSFVPIIQAANTVLTDPLGIYKPPAKTTTTETNYNPVNELAVRLINVVISFIGIITLCMFLYGGLVWMTSGGSDEKIKKGKDILIWAIIGLFIVLCSYTFVHFFIDKILLGTTTTPPTK